MIKKSIRDRIFSALTPLLKEKGFIAFKGKSSFIKKNEYGYQIIGVLIKDYPFRKKYEICFLLGARYNAAEDLMQQVIFVVEKFRGDTLSIQSNFPKLLNKVAWVTVMNEEDVDNLIEAFSKFFIAEGLSFFDSISSIEKIDEIINHPDYDILKSHFTMFNWNMSKIIFAKLNNNINYSTIVKETYVKMKSYGMNPHCFEEFDKMVSILNN